MREKERQIEEETGKRVKHPKLIAITQPRRVAAITVSRRVSQEMGREHGTLVGHKVRFEEKFAISPSPSPFLSSLKFLIRYKQRTSQQTRIKFLTDGMLLREAISDPKLSRYE